MAETKRKLNVFDFLKGDTETLSEQPVPKRQKQDNDRTHDHYTASETPNSDDSKPAFTREYDPVSFTPAQTTTEQLSSPTPMLAHDAFLHIPSAHQRHNKSTEKYGVGAALLMKMGWKPGEGLGAKGQGITEPIEQQVYKQGVGIGYHLQHKDESGFVDEDESSDEEYYKEVPKKSLYQIIREIESHGVTIPTSIKLFSDQHSDQAQTPFIQLKKQGNQELEDVTARLDTLNNRLVDVVTSIQLVDFEIQHLSQSSMAKRLAAYKGLREKLKELDAIVEQEADDTVKLEQLTTYITDHITAFDDISTRIPEHELSKTLTLYYKPILAQLFESWDPLDISNTSLLTQISRHTPTLPIPEELYNEIPHFQSLLHTLWMPKMDTLLSTWPITKPNLIITILLDWEGVLHEATIQGFVHTHVLPKVMDAVKEWDITSRDADLDWLLEWWTYLHDVDDVKDLIQKKYDDVFRHWTIDVDVPSVGVYKELIGEERYLKIVGVLVQRLCSLLANFEYHFDGKDDELWVLDIFEQWREHIPHVILERLYSIGFFNSWLRALYHTLSGCNKKQSGYSVMSDSVNKWGKKLLSLDPDIASVTQQLLYKALDMINAFVDTGVVSPVHASYSKQELIDRILNPPTENPARVETKGIPTHRLQITFKEVVDSYCQNHDLLLMPLRNDFTSSKSLFKISKLSDNKGGVIAYIEEDVLFVKRGEDFTPISLDELDGLV